jgi:chromosomal replication initiation ATPase DnaA
MQYSAARMNVLEDVMAYRFESTQVYELPLPELETELKTAEKKSMQEITKTIWELGKKADSYAQASCLWATKALEQVI